MKYKKRSSVIIPVVATNGNVGYMSFVLYRPLCKRGILHLIRKYLKQTYGASYKKAVHERFARIEPEYVTDSSYQQIVFDEFVDRIIKEEEERRAIEAERSSNNQVENTSSADVSMCPVSDQSDGFGTERHMS